jgi:hypothetical protein
MSAVNESITRKYHRGQYTEMFAAEFEGLAMRLDVTCHGVSEKMRVVNFLNSLSEVSFYRRFVSQTTLAGPRRQLRSCSSHD